MTGGEKNRMEDESDSRSHSFTCQPLKEPPQMDDEKPIPGQSHEYWQLNRQRGERIMQLVKQRPQLLEGSARSPEKIKERTDMWEEVTVHVNEEFAGKLETIDVARIKKLYKYFRGMAHGEKRSLSPDSGILEKRSREEGDEPDESAVSRLLASHSTLLDFMNPQFLQIMSSLSPSDPAGDASSSMNSLYQKKKERSEMICQQADFYLQRLCFDSSARSQQVNFERYLMWQKITALINKTFASQLGELTIDQVKKVFCNCRRRRRECKSSASPSPPPAGEWESAQSQLHKEVLILRDLIHKCETENKTLKFAMKEQSCEYRKRMAALLEVVRLTVDTTTFKKAEEMTNKPLV